MGLLHVRPLRDSQGDEKDYSPVTLADLVGHLKVSAHSIQSTLFFSHRVRVDGTFPFLYKDSCYCLSIFSLKKDNLRI
jgi:hypothetical protein